MEKESNWKTIMLTSSNPKYIKRALEVAPSSDRVLEVTVEEVFQAVNERRQKLLNNKGQ
jgi:hypothetical protein